MELIVGTDSTWSLRALICGQLAGMVFDIRVIDLTACDYQEQLLAISPSGLVPALKSGDLSIHDSLAITEYFNECSNGLLYPSCEHERALARSLCAELHAGFMQLRANCPFTLENVKPLGNMQDYIYREVLRVESIFENAQLPFMFGSAGAVDAFYAILAFRLNTYGIVLNDRAGEYQKSLLDWPILQSAIELAKSWKNN
ncbi:glutathione S-transferase N-terminal domain-containing protein [Aliikangiella maris]|uniref:Glutathione S-transferase N-terminal domain-containing protein n=2 Tax=Aliikangiella maris TaxID=3162458 RepID=A0ABV3MQR9_9GAMM